MSDLTISFTDTLVVVTCWCGMNHAVPKDLRDYQQRQHRDGEANVISIYCPLGHQHLPAGPGEAARLQKQLEAEKARVDYWRQEQERTEARRRAALGQVTKLKKRARGGVCPAPDCKRSFVDLGRHVRTKHPDLVEICEDA